MVGSSLTHGSISINAMCTNPHTPLDPHTYTSGRWLRRDKLERESRYIKFDFDALRERVIELCPGAVGIELPAYGSLYFADAPLDSASTLPLAQGFCMGPHCLPPNLPPPPLIAPSLLVSHYPVTQLSRLSVEVIAGQQRPSVSLI